MTKSTAPATNHDSDGDSQPRWHRLYFLLAAFNILTVCISLYINHDLTAMYESSVVANRVWADRLVEYAHLNALAIETNAPGNDVFESQDVEEASARLDAKFSSFQEGLTAARQELVQDLPKDARSVLVPQFDLVEEAMGIQVEEARSIFSNIRNRDMKGAGERMAAMDHAFYNVTGALASITRDVQNLQHTEIEEQASLAVSMRSVEYALVALVAAMVGLAVLYGTKLADRARVTDRKLRDLVRIAQVNAARAEAADLAKSEFLANMSHEIRTPMTAILGFAQNIADNVTEPENVAAIETVTRNSENLLGIINDILDLSKLEAGKMTIECRQCHPCKIIAEVESLMRVLADAKGLPFTVEYMSAIPETIQSDPARLRQILINLIGNAIKFTESGSVRLLTRFVDETKASSLQFDITDTGRGMSQGMIATLFQPFMQADSSSTRKCGGTGLGLTISQRFAKLLGGDITVPKTELGVGTTFRASITTGPVDDVTMIEHALSATVAAGAEPTATRPELPSLQGLRILLAEDGPDNQRLISFVLKKANADVTVEENGKLALDAALTARDAGKPFDCILMDMQMPVMDGYEATRQLRREGYTGPIVALTAHALVGDREKCIQAGCDDYATKPIDRKTLIETILRNRVPTEAATAATI